MPLDAYRAQKRGGKGRSGMATKEEDFVTRLFVANTHTPVLFFSSRGLVYKEKVWRLPLAAPQARGKALINLLPLEAGERITTIMPLPEDEASWETLDVMFATTGGTVRRNKLSDFVEVNRAGKIAMKLDEGEEIVGVETCTEADDVLLTTAPGSASASRCRRCASSRAATRSACAASRSARATRVISMAILRHFDATPTSAERLPQDEPRGARRGRAGRGGSAEAEEEESERRVEAGELGQERYAEMGAAEQFILTVSENGYGKRTSSFEYRITGRGGKGIVAMAVNERNGRLVASFPVEEQDQIICVTDGGQIIRMPVGGDKPIRIVGRGTQGVTLFDTQGEKVVSVEHLAGDAASGDDEDPAG